MDTIYVSGAYRSQKKVLDLLDLQVLVSHHVGAGNQTKVLCKAMSVFLPLSQFCCPQMFVFVKNFDSGGLECPHSAEFTGFLFFIFYLFLEIGSVCIAYTVR